MIATVPAPSPTAMPTAEVPAPAAQSVPAAPDPSVPPGDPEAQSPADNQGEVLVKARSRAGDPLQDFNVASFNVAQDIDRAVLAPTSKAYRKAIPQPIRSGFGNFLNNLREPVVFLNYMLQLKVGKAAETVGRFAVNSTIGVAGVFDIAKRKPFHLPRRRNSFANTLGFYGVKPGPFFFAPLLGPTTLRDLFGTVIDQAVPIGPIRPFRGRSRTIPIAILSALDYRSGFDNELERQRATEDPYMAARRYYLERRQAEIDALRGRKRVVKPVPVVRDIPPAELVAPIVVPVATADPGATGASE